MRHLILKRLLPLLCCAGFSWTMAPAQVTNNTSTLTNASVVRLVKEHFKEKTIIAIIGSRPTLFDLSTEGLIELKRSGVRETIILAMLARQEGLYADDSLSDEAFFNQGGNKPLDRQKDPAKNWPDSDAGTDIFGSSGGAHGNTKSRGGNSSRSDDTVTTGSATVRILRPPAEPGAVPKLERTSTLTNQSIVELVEAGFSEGTIIRRIELSPVEFDLSPKKIEELRKRRVTEKILSAMKAATGETGDSRTKPASNGTPG